MTQNNVEIHTLSESRRNNAMVKAETLIESAMGEVKSLKESKVIEINNLKKTARINSFQYLKNTSGQILLTHYRLKL